jgi:hypothetical protein
MINGGKRTPGGLVGAILRCKQGPLYGRAEPAPPGGGLAQHGWPCGERSEMTPRGGFLGGAHSVRSRCEAVPIPGHLISRDGRAKGPRRSGDVSG